ncbi:SURF1 family protein [Caulobacter segnis]|uniref:SURF1 family protein n=1 Tax=Caulobacter segnis TaxID=88688 RepID=UPI00240E9D6A|nr:SURF1 family protein [Caulobacter segnis]MDG2521092.1 SURF1 family protein [Caulobacter segnis]
MTVQSDRRFPIGLTVATAISLAILCGLGAWQMQRLAWKQDLLTRIAALQGAAATPWTPKSAEFTRVTLTCPGLAKAPFVQLYAIRDGKAGERIISACPTPQGTVLIDRGFVADTISARPPVDAADRTPVAVIGVLRAGDARSFVTPPDQPQKGQFFARDAAAIGAGLNVSNPAPLFLMAETSTNPEWAALEPAPLPAEISNRHLEYALTWFGLAATLACVYAAMLWRRRRD